MIIDSRFHGNDSSNTRGFQKSLYNLVCQAEPVETDIEDQYQ
jgi:hypothetical protein